jgi:hypothetical protein
VEKVSGFATPVVRVLTRSGERLRREVLAPHARLGA